MTPSLYSPQWYRVASIRPRLRAHVQVRRRHWRDQRWYVLTDSTTGRQHRINEAAYRFIGRCDGQRRVQEVWDALLAAEPELAPTQDEVLQLLGHLSQQQLLWSDAVEHADGLLERRRRRRGQRRLALLNPFGFRLPLGDPATWLAACDPLARALFQPLAFWIWLAAMVLAALLAAGEWPALRSHAAQQALAPALALGWVCYPLMKAVHELAHALAVRRWGGEVHEMGLSLMCLVPVPYVDASAAAAFARRSRRAAVGAAGVMAEMSLAALGLVLWRSTQPGLVHDAAFVVMGIGAVSTLLVNGNPLLRFDAYHVMCDLFDLPNLASRSAAWWGHRLSRLLLRSPTQPPLCAAGELKWLVAFAPISAAYRLLLALGFVLWIGGHWFIAGVLAAGYMAVTLLLRPLLHWAREAMNAALPGSAQRRVRLRLAGVLAASLGTLFLMPVPLSTVAPGVVWLPEHAQVRPEVDGMVAELPQADGTPVRSGDLLLRLENPPLQVARDALASRLEGLQAERYLALLRDPGVAQNLALDIARTEEELKRAQERVDRLEVRAQTAGMLVMPRQADLLGTHVRQGRTLGHVFDPRELRVRAAVAEDDAALLRRPLRRAEVRLADAPARVFAGRLDSDMPAATHELPSAALTEHGGGPYAADPADKDGRRSRDAVFLYDLSLPGETLQRVGGRAWVRFDLGNEPLALQAWRRVLQLFLGRFAPAP